MNYYEHHIGDYDANTAHLTWAEDMAYSRLIRLYYRREKPIPADVADACRLVRATAKDQREAVAAVLAEFFVLREDGWHQARCDQEIQRFQDGEPERQIKKANESNRLRRHRDERSELFKALTEAGHHAPWNIGIGELRAIAKRLVETQPETLQKPLPETAPATPATATQTPDTRHQCINTNTLHLTVESSPDREPDIDLTGHKLNGHAPKTVPDCPHGELLALWAEVMPDLPQHDPQLWPGSTRADHLRARWRSTAALKGWATQDEGIAYFRKLFGWCRRSEFLMGKAASRDRRPFDFELAWLANATNWAKVHEGKFHEHG